jgi:hypothetical protein
MLGLELEDFAEECVNSTGSNGSRYLAADGTYTAAGNAELARIEASTGLLVEDLRLVRGSRASSLHNCHT